MVRYRGRPACIWPHNKHSRSIMMDRVESSWRYVYLAAEYHSREVKSVRAGHAATCVCSALGRALLSHVHLKLLPVMDAYGSCMQLTPHGQHILSSCAVEVAAHGCSRSNCKNLCHDIHRELEVQVLSSRRPL